MDIKSQWNERYSRQNYVYGTEPNTFLQSVTGCLEIPSNILCLAEGEGRNAVFLAAQGHHVAAVDISSAGYEKALRLARENDVLIAYTVSDINHYDFGTETLDAIVSIFAHTDPETLSNTWKKAAAGLKRGGYFILEAYHPRQIKDGYASGGPKDISWLVTLNDLKTAFKGFEILHGEEIERDVTEGSLHTGQAYVTQFIARKL